MHKAFYLYLWHNLSHYNKALVVLHSFVCKRYWISKFLQIRKLEKYFYFYFGYGTCIGYTTTLVIMKSNLLKMEKFHDLFLEEKNKCKKN